MNRFLFYSLIVFGISSCVPQSDYDKVVLENQQLKDELNELKFGKGNLSKDANSMIALKDFIQAKRKIILLNEKHPNSVEAAELNAKVDLIEEGILWQKAMKVDSMDYSIEYLTNYPKGTFTSEIQTRKKNLENKFDDDAFQHAQSLNTIDAYENYAESYKNGNHYWEAKKIISQIKKEQEKEAYEYAQRINSSYTWEKFISDYPNHWNKKDIEKKIIQLKVDEILRDKNTGELPTFSQTNFGYSSSSQVSITNDTGHELTVRYSGPTVTMIVIPIGRTRTTYLKSGSYKIAASAGGLHYAGTESLSGNYSSKYYITTSSYNYRY